jgi:hypothetical protein
MTVKSFVQPALLSFNFTDDGTYNGPTYPAVNVEGIPDFAIHLAVSALTSGTPPVADFWLEGTINGSDWFEVFHDGALVHTGTAADTTASAAGNRNINGAASAAAAFVAVAQYRNRALQQVRINYEIVLAGGSGSAIGEGSIERLAPRIG